MANCSTCPSKGSCGKDESSCGIVNNPHNHIKKVVAVMSGKGGVGKSSMTVLMAKAYASQLVLWTRILLVLVSHG